MKKLLSFLLSLMFILSITTLVACNGGGDDDNVDATPKYDTAYTYNETHHWRKQLNGDGMTEYEEHDDDRGRCECGLYFDYSEYLTFEKITETDKELYRGLQDGYKITYFEGFEYDAPLHIEIPATYQGDEDDSPQPVRLIERNVFGPSRTEGLIAIESIKFNENLTHIGHSAFSGSAVTEVNLPDSVVYIELSAFSGCVELKKVVFGTGFEVLRDYTFSGCTKLEEVIFGPNHKEIKQRDFYSCKSLKSIVLPASLVSIPEDSIAAHGVEHSLYEALAGLENIYLEITEEELLARTIPRAKRDQKTGNRWYEGYDRKGNFVSGYFNIYNFKYVLYADTTYGLVEGWNGTAKLHYKDTWHYDNDGKPVAN